MEDELARDTVRQEANLTLAQDNLTTQQDSVVPDAVVLTSPIDTFQWSQPTFDQVVSRWYKIATPNWPYTASQDTTISSIDVSHALFNITSLFDRVKRFRYWRGNIKVRLQTNSTPFHYGSLFAAIVPFYTNAEAAQTDTQIPVTTFSLSGQKCSGYLSANTGKPLELSCPLQTPYEYLNITQQNDLRPFQLMICVMNPLKVAGGGTNPTLQLSIFAQFEDFKLLAPSEAVANSSSKKIVSGDTEQRNANKQGTLGKVAGAVSNIASKLTAVPVIGSIASGVAPIASAVGAIFDVFGWDKPTNISSQLYTIERQGRGLVFGSGQDPSEPVGLKPDQKLSTEAKHFGLEDPATRSLPALLQTPMWNGSFTIANNQVTENIFKRLFIRPYAPDITAGVGEETQRHDYLSYYSQFFRSCRGGYKYFIHFDTSSYTSARVRLTFEPSNTGVAVVTDGGDSFSRIIDVNGATCVTLEIPYCYPSARMPIVQTINNGTTMNGQLMFSLVNPIQTNGSSADTIMVNIFRCAADDFKFYQLQNFTQSVHLEAQANSLIEQIGNTPTVMLGDGPKVLFDRVTEDEEVVAHNDFLHRYHQVQPLASNRRELYPTAGDPYHWLTPFRAYRGSTRHLVAGGLLSTLTNQGLLLGNNPFPDAPSADSMLAAGSYLTLSSSIVPIEVPYNNNIRFLPPRYSAANWPDGFQNFIHKNGAGSTTSESLWSAGDDFTVGLRRAPASQTIVY